MTMRNLSLLAQRCGHCWLALGASSSREVRIGLNQHGNEVVDDVVGVVVVAVVVVVIVVVFEIKTQMVCGFKWNHTRPFGDLFNSPGADFRCPYFLLFFILTYINPDL